MKTSIERTTERYAIELNWIWYFEKLIIEQFKARAHQHIQSPPKDQDVIEWLSIIQHYGGPTRLLDFSESFYISSFFAIDTAIEDACVWAINETSLRNSINEKTGYKLEKTNQGFTEFAENQVNDATNKYDLVLSIIPSRLNERLSVQKGRFMFPCNVLKSFEENLCATLHFPFNSLESKNSIKVESDNLEDILSDVNLWPSVLKINFSNIWYREAIRDLYSMNIDSASLFPGLEGFAKSLTYIMLKDNYEDII